MMWLNKIFHSFIESWIMNLTGGFGERVRLYYYRTRFKKCGKNVRISVGVIFENPENISVGNNVWFNSYSIITARPLNQKAVIENRIMKYRNNADFDLNIGEVIIGNEVGIGAFSTINGFGGIKIEDRVSLSSYVKLYSFSHMPNDPEHPKNITYASSVIQADQEKIACIQSPIVIRTGVWLGLGVTVLGGTVGKNSFVITNSIVIEDIEENSYAGGNPAQKIKKRFEY